MATTSQNASVHKGAALTMTFTVTDAAGAALSLATVPLYYRVAQSAGGATLLVIDTAAIARTGNVATVTLTREQTVTLPVGTLYHEFYTSDADPAATDDAVFATGILTVLPAQIAWHA